MEKAETLKSRLEDFLVADPLPSWNYATQLLSELELVPWSLSILRASGVAKAVKTLRQRPDLPVGVNKKAKALLKRWQQLLDDGGRQSTALPPPPPPPGFHSVDQPTLSVERPASAQGLPPRVVIAVKGTASPIPIRDLHPAPAVPASVAPALRGISVRGDPITHTHSSFSLSRRWEGVDGCVHQQQWFPWTSPVPVAGLPELPGALCVVGAYSFNFEISVPQ